MLHLAYLFLPAGLVGAALGSLGMVGTDVAAHVFGIGAVGGMTVAVMMRATMGHTGRDLVAGSVLTLAFGLVGATVAARLAGRFSVAGAVDGVTVADILWTAGFALALLRIGPWLVLPRAGRRSPNPAPSDRASRSPG